MARGAHVRPYAKQPSRLIVFRKETPSTSNPSGCTTGCFTHRLVDEELDACSCSLRSWHSVRRAPTSLQTRCLGSWVPLLTTLWLWQSAMVNKHHRVTLLIRLINVLINKLINRHEPRLHTMANNGKAMCWFRSGEFGGSTSDEPSCLVWQIVYWGYMLVHLVVYFCLVLS